MDIQGIFSKAQKEPKKRKKTKTPTNELNASICKFIKDTGNWASRINNMGVYRVNKKTGWAGFTKSTSQNGLPDIIACYEGRFLGVETKHKDSTSDDQIETHQEIKNSGGNVLVVKTFEDFKQKFEEWKTKTK